jgi:glycosyltransferase involved in cell wall biosynthesis
MYGGIMADIVTKALQNTPTPVVVSFCGSDLLGEHLNGMVRKITNHIFGVMASHRAARRAHGIIVKSRNLQNALPRAEDRKRARILANGVSLDRFQPLDRRECREKLGWEPNRFLVLFPTNAGDRRKRLWLAEGAVRVAKESGIDIELVELKGVPHAEVGVWINASDVVILTSQHEGSPNVVKEALACNVPIVSVDVGDVVERLEGIAGCYIAEENERDLGDKLRKVHDGMRVVEGRDKVLELTLERVAERVKAFYEEVLHNYETQTRK